MGTPEWRNANHYWPTAMALAEKNPQAALDWVMGIPPLEGEIAPPGFRAVFETWVVKDMDGVTSWLTEQTNEKWWPRAASGVLKGLRRAGRTQEADAFLARFPEYLQQSMLRDLNAPPVRGAATPQ